MSPTSLAPLKTRLRRLAELRHLVVGVLAERIEAGDQAEVEDVPVVRFQDAVFAGVGRIVPQVPALVLGGLAADLVGVDDEGVGPVALAHAEQLLAVVADRPFVGRLERRHHLLEIGLEARAIERLDQPFRIHDLARPGIVDVDQVPDVGLAGAQPVDHGRVVGEQFRLDRRALRSRGRGRAPGRSCSPPSTGCSAPSRAPRARCPAVPNEPAAKAAAIAVDCCMKLRRVMPCLAMFAISRKPTVGANRCGRDPAIEA